MMTAAWKNFGDLVLAHGEAKKSRLVVGLDPHWHLIPADFKADFAENDHEALLTQYFCQVVDVCLDVAVMFKPQIAFFEQFGLPGLAALQKILTHIHQRGGLVLMDGKRNDIGSTAAAYARAFLEHSDWEPPFSSHALTVNGYLGSDGLHPFLKDPNRGIFVLVKTSNPSSGELQDLQLADGRSVAEAMADQVEALSKASLGNNGYGNVGAVIGATYPEHMEKLRKRMPHAILLVPGYGAQGGDDAAVAAAFNQDKWGALINSSRGICFPKDWNQRGFEAIGQAAEVARAHINTIVKA